MPFLLGLSRLIDRISRMIGAISEYLVLACCLISAANALLRYSFNYSSNGWFEIQWYLFAFIVMLGASNTLADNGHVRVDLLYGALRPAAKLWIDVFGLIVFLIPSCLFLAWLCWPFFALSLAQGEVSSNAGGLIRWPVKLMLVSGFALLALQGLSELIKRLGALTGHLALETDYEKPLQ